MLACSVEHPNVQYITGIFLWDDVASHLLFSLNTDLLQKGQSSKTVLHFVATTSMLNQAGVSYNHEYDRCHHHCDHDSGVLRWCDNSPRLPLCLYNGRNNPWCDTTHQIHRVCVWVLCVTVFVYHAPTSSCIYLQNHEVHREYTSNTSLVCKST